MPDRRGCLSATSRVGGVGPAGLREATFTSVLASSICFSSSYRSLDSHRGCSMLSSITGKSWRGVQLGQLPATEATETFGGRSRVSTDCEGNVPPTGTFGAPRGAACYRIRGDGGSDAVWAMAPGASRTCHLSTYFQGPHCLLLLMGAW